MARTKRVRSDRAEAPAYLAKATEFLDEARAAQVAERWDAAMLTAIHAGINAVDASTIALSGQRSTDPDHLRAVDLLEETAPTSQEVKTQAAQLRRLLSQKNTVEYESRRSRRGEATEAVKRAERLVAWATKVVRDARL